MENQAENSASAAPPPDIFDESDRIVIGTPCYGGMTHYEHMNAVAHAEQELLIKVRQADGTVAVKSLIAERTYLGNESHIDRGRNKLANRFWRGPYNWLLFLDADIVFPKEAIAALWAHGTLRGHRMIAAPYAMKGIVPQFAVNVMPGTQKGPDGLVEVVNAGTGFLLIHREVFAALIKQGRAEEYTLGCNDPHYHTDRTAWDFFKSGVRKVKAPNGSEVKLWLSEDYMLCYEWQKCGGRVMMDYRLGLEHVGTIKFPLDANELAAAYRELERIGHPAVAPRAAA